MIVDGDLAKALQNNLHARSVMSIDRPHHQRGVPGAFSWEQRKQRRDVTRAMRGERETTK